MAPVLLPQWVTRTTGNPVSRRVVPLVPPLFSYSSTCSRTQSRGLGTYLAIADTYTRCIVRCSLLARANAATAPTSGKCECKAGPFTTALSPFGWLEGIASARDHRDRNESDHERVPIRGRARQV